MYLHAFHDQLHVGPWRLGLLFFFVHRFFFSTRFVGFLRVRRFGIPEFTLLGDFSYFKDDLRLFFRGDVRHVDQIKTSGMCSYKFPTGLINLLAVPISFGG